MSGIRADVTFPTLRRDNSALPLSEIANWRLELRAAGASTYTPVGDPMPTSQTTDVISNLAAGAYDVQVICTDTDGQDSVPTSARIVIGAQQPPEKAQPSGMGLVLTEIP